MRAVINGDCCPAVHFILPLQTFTTRLSPSFKNRGRGQFCCRYGSFRDGYEVVNGFAQVISFSVSFFFLVTIVTAPPRCFSLYFGPVFFCPNGGRGGAVVREFAYGRASSCRTSPPPATLLLSIGALLCLYILNPFSLSVLIFFPYFCNRRCGVRAR